MMIVSACSGYTLKKKFTVIITQQEDGQPIASNYLINIMLLKE